MVRCCRSSLTLVASLNCCSPQVQLFLDDVDDFLIPVDIYTARLNQLEALEDDIASLRPEVEVSFREEEAMSESDDPNYIPFRGHIVALLTDGMDEEIPRNPSLRGSGFATISVKWTDGSFNNVSPWDLRLLGNDSPSPDRPSLTDEEKEQVLKAIDTVRSMDDIGTVFGSAVDQDRYSDYSWRVEVPMDLAYIENRVRANYYATKLSVVSDVKLIRENCVKYNGENDDPTPLADQMLSKFEEKVLSEGELLSYRNFNELVAQKASQVPPPPARNTTGGRRTRRSQVQRRSSLEELPDPEVNNGRSLRLRTAMGQQPSENRRSTRSARAAPAAPAGRSPESVIDPSRLRRAGPGAETSARQRRASRRAAADESPYLRPRLPGLRRRGDYASAASRRATRSGLLPEHSRRSSADAQQPEIGTRRSRRLEAAEDEPNEQEPPPEPEEASANGEPENASPAAADNGKSNDEEESEAEESDQPATRSARQTRSTATDLRDGDGNDASGSDVSEEKEDEQEDGSGSEIATPAGSEYESEAGDDRESERDSEEDDESKRRSKRRKTGRASTRRAAAPTPPSSPGGRLGTRSSRASAAAAAPPTPDSPTRRSMRATASMPTSYVDPSSSEFSDKNDESEDESDAEERKPAAASRRTSRARNTSRASARNARDSSSSPDAPRNRTRAASAASSSPDSPVARRSRRASASQTHYEDRGSSDFEDEEEEEDEESVEPVATKKRSRSSKSRSLSVFFAVYHYLSSLTLLPFFLHEYSLGFAESPRREEGPICCEVVASTSASKVAGDQLETHHQGDARNSRPPGTYSFQHHKLFCTRPWFLFILLGNLLTTNTSSLLLTHSR